MRIVGAGPSRVTAHRPARVPQRPSSRALCTGAVGPPPRRPRGVPFGSPRGHCQGGRSCAHELGVGESGGGSCFMQVCAEAPRPSAPSRAHQDAVRADGADDGVMGDVEVLCDRRSLLGRARASR